MVVTVRAPMSMGAVPREGAPDVASVAIAPLVVSSGSLQGLAQGCWALAHGDAALDEKAPHLMHHSGALANKARAQAMQSIPPVRAPPCGRTPLTPSHTPSRTTRRKGDERAGRDHHGA